MSRSQRNRIQDNRDMFAIWAIFDGDSADELLDQHARYREPATRDLVKQYACGFGCTLLWAIAIELALKWLVYKTKGTRPEGHNLWVLWKSPPPDIKSAIEAGDEQDRGDFPPIADILKSNREALSYRYPGLPMTGPSGKELGRANYVLMRVVKDVTSASSSRSDWRGVVTNAEALANEEKVRNYFLALSGGMDEKREYDGPRGFLCDVCGSAAIGMPPDNFTVAAIEASKMLRTSIIRAYGNCGSCGREGMGTAFPLASSGRFVPSG